MINLKIWYQHEISGQTIDKFDNGSGESLQKNFSIEQLDSSSKKIQKTFFQEKERTWENRNEIRNWTLPVTEHTRPLSLATTPKVAFWSLLFSNSSRCSSCEESEW